MSYLDEIEALLAETTGWLEWISPKATTEIAVVYADGDVYLPTGGTEEEFAFANAQGKVRRLVRAEDVAALVKFAREVEALADEWDRAAERRSDLDGDLFDPTAADSYRSRARDLRDLVQGLGSTS